MKSMHHLTKSLAALALFFSATMAQAGVLGLNQFDFFASPSFLSTAIVADTDGENYTLVKSFSEIETIEISTVSTAGAPTVVTFQEVIFNNSGSDWTDFHVHLLPDSGTASFGSITSASVFGGAFTDFGAPFGLADTTGFNEIAFPFQTIDISPDGLNLWLLDGVVAAGDVFSLTYSFTVLNADQSGLVVFEQGPSVVPEPASLALLGLGLVGLGVSRRRKTH